MTTTTAATQEGTMSATEKLAAALAAATDPMTQSELAAAAGVGRSTATTWLGQQVAKGLVVRTMQKNAPAAFELTREVPTTAQVDEALPACDVCLSTGPHLEDCSEAQVEHEAQVRADAVAQLLPDTLHLPALDTAVREADTAADDAPVDTPVEAEAAQEKPARTTGTPRGTVDRILALRDEGLTYAQIGERLMAEGLPPVRAAAWRWQIIRSIILRERGAENLGTARRHKVTRQVWVIPTGQGVRVFATEDDGLAWLNAQTGSLPAPVQVPVLDADGVAEALAKK